MTPLVPIALFGWVPLILLIFTLLPPRRAVVAAFIAGWCFLPMYGYSIPGLPDYNKQNATCFGVLLATAIFDGARFTKFRPRVIDLPMLLWCICPFITNALGEFGPYEGLSTTVRHIFQWGVPYFIGRLYFTDLRSMRELAIGFFVGGLLYVPLCLFEIKMSPQLHRLVYGFFQDEWIMTIRGGGWRPTVFMQHGLAVGMYMCMAALLGMWMWKAKSFKGVLGVPAIVVAPLVFITAILCKSTGAIGLMMAGLAVLWFTTLIRTRWAVRLLVALPVTYMATRTVGGWDARELVDAAQLISDERGGSLWFRLRSESQCWDLVQPKLAIGFGRFVFAGLRLEGSTTEITPDGMWLIALISNGLLGLISLFASMLLPVLAFARRIKPIHWTHPAVAPAGALAVMVALYAIDSLFNAMINPLFSLAAGGLVSTAASIPVSRRAPASAPLPPPPSRPARPLAMQQ